MKSPSYRKITKDAKKTARQMEKVAKPLKKKKMTKSDKIAAGLGLLSAGVMGAAKVAAAVKDSKGIPHKGSSIINLKRKR